jgi:iron complex outermembrane receptor protein
VLLEPQKAKTGEVGVEYERGAWRGRAAFYNTRLENEIYFSPLTFSNMNLAPTRRRGVELEGSWRATPALEWRAALALMEATFRSGRYAGTDVTGKEVPLVPKAIATAGVYWSFAEKSRLNVNVRYVGEQRYDNDQANRFHRQPAYGLVDFKVEHRIQPRVDVAFEVRNAFDKEYYSYGVWNFANSFSAYPAPGRAGYLTLAYRLE